MFSLFKKKVGIRDISFPDFGWELKEEEPAFKQWVNAEQTMALFINFFDAVPDIPTIKRIDELRNFYREQVVQANGGLIGVDLIELETFPAIRTIFKIPQEEGGITYLSSLTIPFKSCSYVIKIQAPELGPTGMKETVIADKLLRQGKITAGEEGYVGWSKDPYEDNFTKGTLMNLSEQAGYDLEFPNHSLSLSRSLIKQIETQCKFSEALKKRKGFDK